MHKHPISARPPGNCTYYELPIPRGAAVLRAGRRYHAFCLAFTLVPLAVARRRRRLRCGLLPAGKDRDARRPNLNKNSSPSTEVGGHA